MPKLLLVDDDKEVLHINAKYFQNLNYTVKICSNASTAMKHIEEYNPDCIVLDVMMPKMDGFQACQKIRQISNAPIIFLTGKDTEEDKIQGLLLGADDYMIKPYSLRELEVRIQVLIRRYQGTNPETSNTLSYPPLTLQLVQRKAFCYDEEILLTNKEYDLLYLLASHPNKVFTFEEIAEKIWGSYLDSSKQTIMVTASRLRKKLEDYPEVSKYIETVWSKGYEFVSK